MSKKEIEAFLLNFKTKQEIKTPCLVVNSDPSVRNSSMQFVTIDQALEMNENGHDVYHYINGGPKNADVRYISHFYIDLDAGRSDDKSYFSLKDVRTRKHEMLRTLKDFPFEPTFIIETRNGYQLYWKLTNTVKKDAYYLTIWKGVQARLVTFFHKCGADKKTIKEAQLYRVPYTKWNKLYEGIKPYPCSILHQSTKNYLIRDFSNELSGKLKITPYTRIPSIVSSGISYTKPASINVTNSTPSPETDVNNDHSSLMKEVSDFLDQIARPLAATNNKFLSSSAQKLSSQIVNTFGLE